MWNMEYLHTFEFLGYLEWMKCDDSYDYDRMIQI